MLKNHQNGLREIGPEHFLAQLGHLVAIFANLEPILGPLEVSWCDFGASMKPFWTLESVEIVTCRAKYPQFRCICPSNLAS